jgi:hypothetical protein
MKNSLLLCFIVFVMSSCATTGLYDWGNYEDALFDYYHQPETKDDMVTGLLKHLEKQEAKGRTPAPGLYAEAGTFFLMDGDRAAAIELYRKESFYWPESRMVMERLIQNLEAN